MLKPQVSKMKRHFLVVLTLSLLGGCAPSTVSTVNFGEILKNAWEETTGRALVDIGEVVPGPGRVYTSRIYVRDLPDEYDLTDPDPRISEPAFRRLQRLLETYGADTPPEYFWRLGLYWKFQNDAEKAASAFNRGIRALASAKASFDAEGRDIWDYAYERTLAYIQLNPTQAVRDAKILASRASPSRNYPHRQFRDDYGTPQKLKGLELLAQAQLAAKDYSGALETTEKYLREWNDTKENYRYSRSFWSVFMSRAKALEALGRTEEARRAYIEITQRSPQKTLEQEAKARLERLGPPPTQVQPPKQQEEGRIAIQATSQAPTQGPEAVAKDAVERLLAALRGGDLLGADRYLVTPRFDPTLQGRLGTEARARAERARMEVSRVFSPNLVQPLPLVEVIYDFGRGVKTVRLPVLVSQGEAKILNGEAPMLGTILAIREAIQGTMAFLEEYLVYLGLQ